MGKLSPHEEFERRWAEWSGSPFVVGCASGTAALHLALETFRIPPGGEVLLPDYAMVACARAVVLAGLKPVFVDVDPVTLLIDPARAAAYVTRKTWAVMAVHTYGRRCHMDALAALCNAHDLYLIEDSAEAHGVRPHPSTDAVCHSFYKNKVVFGEEGGAVGFPSRWEAERARSLRSLGFTAAHDYWHAPRGHNYRLSDAHARLILNSMNYTAEELDRRRRQVAALDDVCPQAWRQPPWQVPWVYDVRVPGMTPARQRLAVEALRACGVPARYGFRPLSLQPEFNGDRDPSDVLLAGAGTNAARAAVEVIYLQLGQSDPDMNPSKARLAFDVIGRYAG